MVGKLLYGGLQLADGGCRGKLTLASESVVPIAAVSL